MADIKAPVCGSTLTFWTPKADDDASTFRECVEDEGHVTPHRSKENYRWAATASEHTNQVAPPATLDTP